MNVLLSIALVVAILTGLLAIPLELQYRFAVGDQSDKRMRLIWAFGLARFSLRTKQPKQELKGEPAASQPAADKTTKDSKRSRGAAQRVLRVLSDEALRSRVLRYLGNVWRAIDKRDLRLSARIGLGDPADTGQLWAVAGPFAAAMSNLRDATVNIEPDFDEEIIAMDTSGRIKAMPLQLIGLTLVLLMSPSLLRHLLRR